MHRPILDSSLRDQPVSSMAPPIKIHRHEESGPTISRPQSFDKVQTTSFLSRALEAVDLSYA